MKKVIGLLVLTALCSCSWLTEDHNDWPIVPPMTVHRTNASDRAVCIGWNSVDPAKWGGWSGNLEDCEFDAKFAADMLESYGIRAKVLLTREATIEACRLALKESLYGMVAGDMLVVWTSGHGGQAPDAGGDESDGLDEYLCAYDGPITDDTINEWLTAVPAGVRVLWICDTCHSGTMFKRAPVRFRNRAIPRSFAGQLILLAGCAEDKYSLSTGQGGMWSTALHDTGPAGRTPVTWFKAAKAKVPETQQIPVYVEYGPVQDGYRNGLIVNE